MLFTRRISSAKTAGNALNTKANCHKQVTPVRLAIQDGLENYTRPVVSANKSNDQSVTIRSKSCKRFGAEEEESSSRSLNLNLTEEQQSTNVIAGDIMVELKLFSDKMRVTREEMGMFRETVAVFTTTIKAQNIRIEQLENKATSWRANLKRAISVMFKILKRPSYN